MTDDEDLDPGRLPGDGVPGRRLQGPGLALLADIMEVGVGRVIDLVFIRKEPDSSISIVDVASLGDGVGLDLAALALAQPGAPRRDRDRRGGQPHRRRQLSGDPGVREGPGAARRRRAPPAHAPPPLLPPVHPSAARRQRRVTVHRPTNRRNSSWDFSAGLPAPPRSPAPPPPSPTGSPAVRATGGRSRTPSPGRGRSRAASPGRPRRPGSRVALGRRQLALLKQLGELHATGR